ncbi:hypothetical protein A3D78_06610 [Candidatus Gottesmanbacteria bacterium RIFCSPHIGHO2_02_FULL_39_14]|uniref:Uncharacterized protein n=1 Tax=Candidatus Gottesmanbacteria bacterium RIFCSPHIGHO2_02_FULL_39_14 TaxID=1798383 RepID=A0A1F5ZWY8_9BACT|nr:MAG: hypothetical protein A3D78_06610 [Candidatus Gottesmanbacteria bacterium RIFCSPHIGHO2_02_FULL_39_14]
MLQTYQMSIDEPIGSLCKLISQFSLFFDLSVFLVIVIYRLLLCHLERREAELPEVERSLEDITNLYRSLHSPALGGIGRDDVICYKLFFMEN